MQMSVNNDRNMAVTPFLFTFFFCCFNSAFNISEPFVTFLLVNLSSPLHSDGLINCVGCYLTQCYIQNIVSNTGPKNKPLPMSIKMQTFSTGSIYPERNCNCYAGRDKNASRIYKTRTRKHVSLFHTAYKTCSLSFYWFYCFSDAVHTLKLGFRPQFLY